MAGFSGAYRGHATTIFRTYVITHYAFLTCLTRYPVLYERLDGVRLIISAHLVIKSAMCGGCRILHIIRAHDVSYVHVGSVIDELQMEPAWAGRCG